MKMFLLLLALLLCQSVIGQDPYNCSKYGSCEACGEGYGHNGNCGWCASDANGGGVCQSMHGASVSIPGCDADMWNKACCSSYTTCDACNKKIWSNCMWCGEGSKVNGGKCIPYSGSMSPQLGGCDAGFYFGSCCGDFTSCNDCKAGGYSCGWCNVGSSVNSAKCIPAYGSMQPGYGGCDATYWDKYHVCPADVPCGKNCASQKPGTDGCEAKVDPSTGNTVGVCTKCKVGFYGDDCGQSCPEDCLTGCDQDSGECFGCTDGLCGFSCDDECTNGLKLCKSCDQGCGKCTSCLKGTYDLDSNCGELCGNCADFDCDDRDGECSGQCLQGWSGMKCDTPCSASCSFPKVCMNDACVCGPGYDSGALGSCVESSSKPSCETCQKLVEAAQVAVKISKKYSSYAEAEAALAELSCFFLPGPAGIGCAAIIATEGLAVWIVSQVAEKLLNAGFCIEWGLCPA